MQKPYKLYHCYVPLFSGTSKTAKIIWYLLVPYWVVDVIEVIYYIHGPMEDYKKPNIFCCL